MNKDKDIRFLFDDPKAANFVYRPPTYDGPKAIDSTVGVKFAQASRILDDYWIIGGTPWSRMRLRLKHPIIYSKRGLRNLYRRIRRLFIKDKMRPC